MDTSPNKMVHLMFLAGGFIAFGLIMWTMEWVFGFFGVKLSDFIVIGASLAIVLTAGIILYRNEGVYDLANDIAIELKKVTWPTRKETQAATVVVIITVLISAAILQVFDAVWSAVTDTIYG